MDKPNDLDSIDYDFTVLIKMVEQLPDGVCKPLRTQIQKTQLSVINYNKALIKALGDNIDSLRLSVLAQKFDLDVTRREKKELQDKLDRGFNDP